MSPKLERAISVAVVLLLVVATVGYGRFAKRRDTKYEPPLDRVDAVRSAPSDAAAIAHGDHLAHTLGGCASCHGADLGGRVMSEDELLRVVAPNLTPGEGSAVVGYSAADWVRAIVHGVGRNGRSLIVMPSKELAAFADSDVAALIAYMRSLRPVDRTLPSSAVSPLGGVVFGLAGAPIFSAEAVAMRGDAAATEPHQEAPPVGPTRAYGEYLSKMCRGCHGEDLRGGRVVRPGAPPSGDLSAVAMATWTYPEFERALREGKKRSGQPLAEEMPWDATRGLTDDELQALWRALRHE